MEPVWAIGLMTGTVLDGMIDIALIRTDGEAVQGFGPWTLAPYPPATRALLGAGAPFVEPHALVDAVGERMPPARDATVNVRTQAAKTN